jgi:hypothetical protein
MEVTTLAVIHEEVGNSRNLQGELHALAYSAKIMGMGELAKQLTTIGHDIVSSFDRIEKEVHKEISDNSRKINKGFRETLAAAFASAVSVRGSYPGQGETEELAVIPARVPGRPRQGGGRPRGDAMMRGFTDYPFVELGDSPLFAKAPIRACTVIAYDRNKYCKILVDERPDLVLEVKRGYIYAKKQRLTPKHSPEALATHAEMERALPSFSEDANS